MEKDRCGMIPEPSRAPEEDAAAAAHCSRTTPEHAAAVAEPCGGKAEEDGRQTERCAGTKSGSFVSPPDGENQKSVGHSCRHRALRGTPTVLRPWARGGNPKDRGNFQPSRGAGS